MEGITGDWGSPGNQQNPCAIWEATCAFYKVTYIIPWDPSSPKLRMVSWNLNPLRFGGDYCRHPLLILWRVVIGSLGMITIIVNPHVKFCKQCPTQHPKTPLLRLSEAGKRWRLWGGKPFLVSRRWTELGKNVINLKVSCFFFSHSGGSTKLYIYAKVYNSRNASLEQW